jgi:2-dehydropantoate 2-reductase
MKIAVMGAGGVGGYYGGLLAKAGQDVTFIARGAHLAALRAHGLKVESQTSGDFALPAVAATGTPASLGTVDLVLMTTKTFDLEIAARALLPALHPQSMVLPLLNGVDIADRLAEVVGPERVLGGMCQVSCSIKAPGVIRQAGPLNKIVFGELKGGTSPRSEAVLAVLKGAGITAELSPAIQVDIWAKFLFIGALGGVCALTRCTAGPVLQDPDTRALFVGCMQEIEALARRKGVALPTAIVADTLARCDKLPAETRPSLLLAVEQGKPLELDALNGTAARLGREWAVPTPVNQFITTALKLVAGGKR